MSYILDGLESMEKSCSGNLYKKSIISESSENYSFHDYSIALYIVNSYLKKYNIQLDPNTHLDFIKILEISIKSTPLIKRKNLIDKYKKELNI